jgi:hypothetical protein
VTLPDTPLCTNTLFYPVAFPRQIPAANITSFLGFLSTAFQKAYETREGKAKKGRAWCRCPTALPKTLWMLRLSNCGGSIIFFVKMSFVDHSLSLAPCSSSADFVPCRGLDPKHRAIFDDTVGLIEYIPEQQLGPSVCRASVRLRSA